MITGDGNLVELQGTLRYTIADPRVYLFEAADPPAVLRSAAESVLREMAASRTFAELLTTDRALLRDRGADPAGGARPRVGAGGSASAWRACRCTTCTRRRRWWWRTTR